LEPYNLLYFFYNVGEPMKNGFPSYSIRYPMLQ
jgi:hypothetical protein